MSSKEKSANFLRTPRDMRELQPILRDADAHFQTELQGYMTNLAEAERDGNDDVYQNAGYNIVQTLIGRAILERFAAHSDFVYFFLEVVRTDPNSGEKDTLVSDPYNSPREAFNEIRKDHGGVLPADVVTVELYVSDTSGYEEIITLSKDRWSVFLKPQSMA